MNETQIRESSVNEALLVFSECATYEMLAYIILVSVLPFYPDAGKMGPDVSTANPLQGVVYYYIISNFLCYCHDTNKCAIPGFDTVHDGQTRCARVKAKAEAEVIRLTEICQGSGYSIDPDAHFFKPMPEPRLILKGDRDAAGGDRDGRFGPDMQEEGQGGNEGDGGNL